MASAEEAAVLRVELEGVEPLVWRRVAVRAAMTLTDVHRVVQAAMGWLDCHLWHVEADGRRFAMRVPGEPEWNERYEDAAAVTLSMLAQAGVRRFSYVYDMGDYWEHAVMIEKSVAPLPDVRYPQFLGGERRCPPEDCGGPDGYFEFIKNISSKNRRVRDEALRWYGGPYDPDDIGESKIVDALGEIGRASNAG
jgi:Plasmid pRiA4b ORF-3-like protein